MFIRKSSLQKIAADKNDALRALKVVEDFISRGDTSSPTRTHSPSPAVSHSTPTPSSSPSGGGSSSSGNKVYLTVSTDDQDALMRGKKKMDSVVLIKTNQRGTPYVGTQQSNGSWLIEKGIMVVRPGTDIDRNMGYSQMFPRGKDTAILPANRVKA